jgi:hypothetical protein
VSLCLDVQTEITGAAILTYVSQHLWPPVGPGDEFEGFPVSWMSGDERVMVLSHDPATEFVVFGHIDPVMEEN